MNQTYEDKIVRVTQPLVQLETNAICFSTKFINESDGLDCANISHINAAGVCVKCIHSFRSRGSSFILNIYLDIYIALFVQIQAKSKQYR